MLSLNHMNLHEIDTTPTGTAIYSRLGDGISSAALNGNEKVDSKSYLNDNGGESSNVVGNHLTWDFSGDRIPGDAAQDFIASKILALGSGRITNFRNTLADGTIISGPVTMSDIVITGGDAAAISSFGVKIGFNGMPAKTDPVAATALGAVIAAAASTIGCTKATVASPTSGAHLAYKLTPAAEGLKTAKNREYVNPAEVVQYTSAADIPATAGQYLSVYEIDAMDHLVKFLCEVLEAGDIKSA
jgi:hypothetical protein